MVFQTVRWKAYEMKYDDEVGGEDNEIGYVTELVADLQPFTQYAAYVQTYTISSARSGAISPIIYFTTLPSSKLYFCENRCLIITENDVIFVLSMR